MAPITRTRTSSSNLAEARRRLSEGTALEDLPPPMQRAVRERLSETQGAARVRKKDEARLAANVRGANDAISATTLGQLDESTLRTAASVNRSMKENKAILDAAEREGNVVAKVTNTLTYRSAEKINDALGVAAEHYRDDFQRQVASGNTGRAALAYTGGVLTGMGDSLGANRILDVRSTPEQVRSGATNLALMATPSVAMRGGARAMKNLELTERQAARVAQAKPHWDAAMGVLTREVKLPTRARALTPKLSAPKAAPSAAVAAAPSTAHGPDTARAVFGRDARMFGGRWSDVQAAGAYLDEVQAPALARLTTAEVDAATRYKLGSGVFNHPLRGTAPMDAAAKARVGALTSAVDKGRLTEDMVLSRRIDASVLDQNLKNGVLHEPGFSSTTACSKVSVAPDQVTMRIFAPKGTRALYLDPRNPGMTEAELLLQRGATFDLVRDVPASAHEGRVVYLRLRAP